MTKLVSEFNYYLKILNALYLELESLPSGSLIKMKGAVYYHKINGKCTGITNNIEMIHQLARKKFIVTFIKIIEDNFSIMKKSLILSPRKAPKLDVAKLKSLHPRDIIKSLPESYQGLSELSFYHPFATKWFAADSKPNEYKRELLTHKSKGGKLFRSRGEQSFANLLEDNGLPYKSDVELILGGIKKFPDFIVLNPFIGKLTVLEFFGLANQSGYDEQMNSKMDWYRLNGCNVIYLFESDIRDSQHLQNLIDEKIWGV